MRWVHLTLCPWKRDDRMRLHSGVDDLFHFTCVRIVCVVSNGMCLPHCLLAGERSLDNYTLCRVDEKKCRNKKQVSFGTPTVLLSGFCWNPLEEKETNPNPPCFHSFLFSVTQRR